jgi:hypothetical protein
MFKTASKSNAQPSLVLEVQVPPEKIAMRAYEKWCQRGYMHGADQQDWLEAERELVAELNRTGSKTNRR